MSQSLDPLAVADASFDALARSAGQQRAGPTASDEAAEELCELLVLWLDEDPYALPIERVREIVRLRPITPVPHVPEAVRGVISLRGEMVQVIDLRRCLRLPGLGGDATTRRERIVVVHGDEGQLAGVLVDRVSEVLRVPEAELRAPAGRDVDVVHALAPYAERFVSLFEVDRLLALAARDERGETA